jgi:hypothetical protein
MDWKISAAERTHLRELARRQAEYASLPVMSQRKKMWLDLNDGKAGARPPFIVETWTFDRDFMPDSLCLWAIAGKMGRVLVSSAI